MAVKYYELTDENRIVMTADRPAPGAKDPRSYDFPEDFLFACQHDYRLMDDQLIHDPLPVETTPGYDERIADLEEALELLISGVTE